MRGVLVAVMVMGGGVVSLCGVGVPCVGVAEAARDLRPPTPAPPHQGAGADGPGSGAARLSLDWEREMLTIRGEGLPGGELSVWYLEAFCRAGSTDREWSDTVIPHTTELVERGEDGSRLVVRSTLADGVIVESVIEAGVDEVRFDVTARNPTERASEAHWAQPCVRVDRFVGMEAKHGSEEYLPKCFVFVDGKATFLPTRPWATEARYEPGQVWCPRDVPRSDVNPRPLSAIVPSNGLIGCVSADGSKLLAMAWEPYQELFQGVIVCLHSDFRIGGLAAGESKRMRGRIYVMAKDFEALERRYRRDFPVGR